MSNVISFNLSNTVNKEKTQIVIFKLIQFFLLKVPSQSVQEKQNRLKYIPLFFGINQHISLISLPTLYILLHLDANHQAYIFYPACFDCLKNVDTNQSPLSFPLCLIF